MSPIHDAVVKGDLQALRKILSQDAEEVSHKDEFVSGRLLPRTVSNADGVANKGNSPLHLATDRGHLEVVRALLEAGADKSALVSWKGLQRETQLTSLIQDEDDQTPLIIAQMLGRDDIAALLR